MTDYYEIDHLPVGDADSGDAIPLRYHLNGNTYIHVVDGGFQATGESVVEHIKAWYDKPAFIDHVVVTHSDGDHAGGLQAVLEAFQVGTLWMMRPWLYADVLIDRFARFSSVKNLKARLREIYPPLAKLEEIAYERNIPICEPFQGERIGAFTVLAPSRERYLDLLVESDKSPEAAQGQVAGMLLASLLKTAAAKVTEFVRAAWGVECFSSNDTSAENDMSVIQYARLCGRRILLTGDAGRGALAEAASYATAIGVQLPGIDRFQVPHHGSRRNLSTDVLDWWLGPRLVSRTGGSASAFTAVVSAARNDKDHPRRAVVRAMHHRGGEVVSTQGSALRLHQNAPDRGWKPATPLPYPDEQEK